MPLELQHPQTPKMDRLHHYGDWLWSIKQDGMRAYWDGGVTAGIEKFKVPFANLEKDTLVQKREQSTGLWSRSGNIIRAPQWWLDQLPQGVALDGELMPVEMSEWDRHTLVGVVKRLEDHPDWNSDWYYVCFHPFDRMKTDHLGKPLSTSIPFRVVCREVERYANDIIVPVEQHSLKGRDVAEFFEWVRLEPSIKEGVVLRCPFTGYMPKKHDRIVKFKKREESDGIVTGYVAGLGKFLGMIGSLEVQDEKSRKLVQVSGLSDELRRFSNPILCGVAAQCPGKVMGGLDALYQDGPLPIGTRISFTHMGRSAEGIPLEAQFLKVRGNL